MNRLKREKGFKIFIKIYNIQMTEDFVYLLLKGSDWEDVTVYLSKEDAINASKIWPNYRVEIFGKKSISSIGYCPTYDYYKNGEYVQSG
jgi:hypothetical protein